MVDRQVGLGFHDPADALDAVAAVHQQAAEQFAGNGFGVAVEEGVLQARRVGQPAWLVIWFVHKTMLP